MKLRDSGMPEEACWESLLDVPLILDEMGITNRMHDVVELGCGFGTFSLPLAKRIAGKVFTFDIDPAMVRRTTERANIAGLTNLVCSERDVVDDGFGLPPRSVDAALLFNILHCEAPETLLSRAAQVVRTGGHVLVIHWRCDVRTPRGPDPIIRPRPEQIIAWAQAEENLQLASAPIDLPPWHYGLRFTKLDVPAASTAAKVR